MRKPLMAGVSAFAHLLGVSAAKGARAEDDDDTRDDEARAEDGDDEDDDEAPPKDAKKSKKAKAKAEDGDDDDDAKAEDGDGDGDDEDPPKDARKSKKAKAKAEDDDDEDGDDDDDSEQAKGAKAERARWTRVLSSSAAAGGRIAAACELLSGTNLKASAVISTLNALPASQAKGGLAQRMAGVRTPNVGGDGGGGRLDPKSPEGKAAAIVAAGKKRRGEL